MIVGQDASKWQGDINFDTYKSNTNFLLFKASEGVGYVDTKFARNKSECLRVGIPFGTYHFARPDLGNGAEAEADYYLKVVGTLNTGEWLTLDYEPKWTGDAVGWCLKWLKRVEAVTRVKPPIYLNQAQAKGFNWQPIVDNGNALWLACYTGDPNNNACTTGNWKSMAMQQWTNAQTVPGISGNVDGDAFFGDLDAFKKYGYQPETPPQPPTPPENCEKWNALCASLELDPVTTTPEQVVNIIGGYKSAKTIAEAKLAEYQGQVTNLAEQVERLKVQIANLETNQVSLTEQLKAKQDELNEMARLKGELVIKLQGVSNELETLKKQIASQEYTITRKQLWRLLVDGKITIKG